MLQLGRSDYEVVVKNKHKIFFLNFKNYSFHSAGEFVFFFFNGILFSTVQ